MPQETPHHGSRLKCTSPAEHLSWPDQISVYAGEYISWWHIPSEWKYGAIIITITFNIIPTFIIMIIITFSPVRSPSSKGNPSNFKFFDFVKTAAPPAWWSFSLNQILLRAWKPESYLQNWCTHKKRILRPSLSQITWVEAIDWFDYICKCFNVHLKEGWQPVADVHLASCNSSGCAHAKLFNDIFARYSAYCIILILEDPVGVGSTHALVWNPHLEAEKEHTHLEKIQMCEAFSWTIVSPCADNLFPQGPNISNILNIWNILSV